MSKSVVELLNLMKNVDFEQATKYLQENVAQVDKQFQDKKGNTFVHLAILSLQEKLQSVWRNYTRSTYKLSELEVPKSTTNGFVENFDKFVDSLLILGFPYNEANAEGIVPIYI